MKMLQAKLLRWVRKKAAEVDSLKGEKRNHMGSQIRSYVFTYTMVKDHQYKLWSFPVDKVMDGDLRGFSSLAYLKWESVKMKDSYVNHWNEDVVKRVW